MTMPDVTTPTTWGMQLDAALSQLDSLSSPQLYGVIVLVTVLIATLLLGNAPALDESAVRRHAKTTTTTTAKTAVPTTTTNTNAVGGAPEPRWYIFRLVNYAMLVIFGISVVEFFTHANDIVYAKDPTMLLRVLLAWCLALIYFFGFFGVSIVHSDVVVAASAETTPSSSNDTSTTTNSTPTVATTKTKKKTPCSEPTKTKEQPPGYVRALSFFLSFCWLSLCVGG